MNDLLGGLSMRNPTFVPVLGVAADSSGPEPPAFQFPVMMELTALVFLDDPLARRLAVAWKACGGDELLWATAAGVPNSLMADAHRLGRALRMNGICRAGGVTDEMALRYIGAITAELLEKRGQRGKRKR